MLHNIVAKVLMFKSDQYSVIFMFSAKGKYDMLFMENFIIFGKKLNHKGTFIFINMSQLKMFWTTVMIGNFQVMSEY